MRDRATAYFVLAAINAGSAKNVDDCKSRREFREQSNRGKYLDCLCTKEMAILLINLTKVSLREVRFFRRKITNE